jgi:hypothetical protein
MEVHHASPAHPSTLLQLPRPEHFTPCFYPTSNVTPGTPGKEGSPVTQTWTPSREITHYACPVPSCTKVYRKPCLLQDHLRTHTGEVRVQATRRGRPVSEHLSRLCDVLRYFSSFSCAFPAVLLI